MNVPAVVDSFVGVLDLKDTAIWWESGHRKVILVVATQNPTAPQSATIFSLSLPPPQQNPSFFHPATMLEPPLQQDHMFLSNYIQKHWSCLSPMQNSRIPSIFYRKQPTLVTAASKSQTLTSAIKLQDHSSNREPTIRRDQWLELL